MNWTLGCVSVRETIRVHIGEAVTTKTGENYLFTTKSSKLWIRTVLQEILRFLLHNSPDKIQNDCENWKSCRQRSVQMSDTNFFFIILCWGFFNIVDTFCLCNFHRSESPIGAHRIEGFYWKDAELGCFCCSLVKQKFNREFLISNI